MLHYVKENEVIREEKFREAQLPLENLITREQQGRIHAPGQRRGELALPRVAKRSSHRLPLLD